MDNNLLDVNALRSLLDDFRSGKLTYRQFKKRLSTLSREDLAWLAQESRKSLWLELPLSETIVESLG